jgi:WD40 repeat protein
MLATGGGEEDIILWSADSGKEVGRLSQGSVWVSALAFSPDGKRLLSVTGTKLNQWDVPGRKRLSSMLIPAEGDCSAISPDRCHLAFRGRTGVHLFDVSTGVAVRHFEGPLHVAISSDGKRLALGGRGQSRLLEVASGKLLRTFSWLEGAVLGIDLSPDGRLVAVGAYVRNKKRKRVNATRLFGVSDGSAWHSMEGHPGGNYRILFSPDSRSLATAGQDGLIRLWEACTGEQRVLFTGHRGGIVSLTFFPDGKRLASSGEDTTALVWDLTGRASRKLRDRLDAKALAAVWADLAGADAAKAYRAVQDLAAAPRDAVSFLHKRLEAVAPAEAKQVARLIAELDSDEPDVRKRAAAALEAFGELAGPAMREASQRAPSAEVARQLKRLLAAVERDERAPAGDRLRLIRAVEVLERAGNPAARAVLARLAKGAPQARVTQDAKASLTRLEKQAGVKK